MSQKTDKEGVFRHADNVAWRQSGKEVILLDLNSSEYFSLNEIGALIWEGLCARHPVPKIVDAVCGKFEAEPAQVTKDVNALIQQLLKKKLLQPLEGPAR